MYGMAILDAAMMLERFRKIDPVVILWRDKVCQRAGYMVREKVAAREGRIPRETLSKEPGCLLSVCVLCVSESESERVCVCAQTQGLMTNWPQHNIRRQAHELRATCHLMTLCTKSLVKCYVIRR